MCGYEEEFIRTHPCTSKNKAEIGAQCRYCYKADKINPCIKCNGLSCNATSSARRFCRENQFITYFVNFGSIIKVGVSYKQRLRKRWIEQGADNGVKFYKGNGREARIKKNELNNYYTDRVMIKK